MEKEITHKGLRARLIENSNRYIREDGVVLRKYLSREGYKETRGGSDKKRYPTVVINGKAKLIHRLVAEAFIPNPDKLPIVDHINEDKHDCRVENLRWCTIKENAEFYHKHPSREEKRNLLQDASTKEIILETRVKELSELLEIYEERNRELSQEVQNLKKSILFDKKSFDEYVKKEEERLRRINSNYEGYKDVKGVQFKNVEAMVKATGKKVIVNGKEFPSAGEAARYIQNKEERQGYARSKATISKEIRKYLQGKRPPWVMYGKYTIGS